MPRGSFGKAGTTHLSAAIKITTKARYGGTYMEFEHMGGRGRRVPKV